MKHLSYKFNLNNPRLNYIVMTSVVFVCAFEFIFAKSVLAVIPALTLIMLKYSIALVVLFCIKLEMKNKIRATPSQLKRRSPISRCPC